MLIGIFELIALEQDEYVAYHGYLEAIRDYWLARVDLSLATGTVLPSSANIPDERIHVEEFVRLSFLYDCVLTSGRFPTQRKVICNTFQQAAELQSIGLQ